MGSLAGTVVDVSGASIPGAQLTLRGVTGDIARIQSGREGEFRFPNLPPGTYSIEAAAPGLITKKFTEIRVAGGAEVIAAIAMEVDDRGGMMIWASGKLPPGPAQGVGSVVGTVVDAAGAGVWGAQLTLRGMNGELVVQTPSGGAGEFRFSNVPPGTYSIEATARRLTSKGAKDVKVTGGAETAVKIVMEVYTRHPPRCDTPTKITFDPIQSTSSEIAGKVEVPAATYPYLLMPAESILVTVTGGEGRKPVGSARTDAAGNFKLAIQNPGKYTLTIHRDGYADFIADGVEARTGERTSIQWSLLLSRCHRVDHCEPVRDLGTFLYCR